MNLLLDTHIFLWFISGDKHLPIGMRDSIRDLNNEVYLSVVSLWERFTPFRCWIAPNKRLQPTPSRPPFSNPPRC